MTRQSLIESLQPSLFEDTLSGSFRNIFSGMACNCHAAGFCGMPIDSVASFSALQVPAVLLDELGYIAIFHLSPRQVYLALDKYVAELCGEGGAAAAGFGGVGIDEVEALAHEGLFVVEDHAAEVDEAFGVDEDADGRQGVGRRRGWGRLGQGGLGEGVDAVAVAGLGVEADVVAEAGAAASADAEAEAAG